MPIVWVTIPPLWRALKGGSPLKNMRSLANSMLIVMGRTDMNRNYETLLRIVEKRLYNADGLWRRYELLAMRNMLLGGRSVEL